MYSIMETIKTIRNLRAEIGVQPKKQSEVILSIKDSELVDVMKSNEIYLTKLAAADPIKYIGDEKPEHALTGVVDGIEIFLRKISGFHLLFEKIKCVLNVDLFDIVHKNPP